MAKKKSRKTAAAKKGSRKTAAAKKGGRKPSAKKSSSGAKPTAMSLASAFNAAVLGTLRHRALCKSGDLYSEWQLDIEDARQDANDHQQLHHDHDIRIITEQTTSVKFTG
jgi:hypothetical protein